jgi:mono/diheme cytochrome c family protein
MKKLVLSIGLFLAITTSCSNPTSSAIVSQTETNNTNSEILLEGQKLYDQHCMGCHQFKPVEFKAKKWARYMPKMARKSKIDKKTSDKILLYVSTFSKK